MLPPNFKIFNRALNKIIVFLLEWKFVSTSRKEDSLKKRFPWEKLFSLPGISDKWKKKVFHEPEKQFLLAAMEFFCNNWLWLISIMVTISKKNIILLYYYIILLLFPLVETILLKLRRIQFFKNNPLPVSENEGESNF